MTPEQQAILTRVGPGTPMGELLRRYWFPVAASCELPAGAVRQVRLLGEDLVVFRSLAGELGLLEEHCPHRRASLRYGCVEDDGIRCAYHGWKFSPAGRCLEMPAERTTARRLERAATRGFHVAELGGLVFGYLGPEPAPLLPRYDLFVWEGTLRDIGRALIPCNWLQIMENSVDPIHLEWLHGHQLASVRRARGLAEPRHYRKRQIRIGFDPFRYGIVKRRVVEGGSEEDDDWKIGHPLIFPVSLRVGSDPQHRFQIRVPVDDTHTRHYWYSCYRAPDGEPMPPQAEIPVYDVPWRDERGDFIVDYVDGQDIMTWVTQGAIADRTREHLAASDSGIVLLRKLLFEQLARVEQGLDPLGVVRDPEENRIIELPQERNKYRDGAGFLADALELSHVRYSPLREELRRFFAAGRRSPGTPP
jgi:5,5'-dehydrodivanillate O-demethylase oxygenase subunit